MLNANNARPIAIAGAMLLALHSFSWATTYFVGGNGNDTADGLSIQTPFRTLQHAANLTHPGDIVYALNGTYSNPSPTGSVLNIATPGTATEWITYAAFPGQQPLISFNSWAGISFGTTAAYIEVRGFSIQGNNYNVTLQGAVAEELVADPLYNGNCVVADGRTGTATQRPHHLRLIQNTIGACGGAGIAAIQTDYVTISDNTAYDSAWYSIYGNSGIAINSSWNSDGYTGYKFFITRNRIFGNQEFIPWKAVGYISDGEGLIIDSNHNTSFNIYNGRTLIADNVLYQNGSAAVEVYLSDHVDIFNNSTYGNDISTAPKLQGRGEVNLNRVADVNVLDNILYSANGQPPASFDGYPPCDCTFNYNLYYNGANGPGVVEGPNDAYGDPFYVNPLAQDRFHVDLNVKKESPAIDSGTAWIDHYSDFMGKPRPLGASWDRGAYEKLPSLWPLF